MVGDVSDSGSEDVARVAEIEQIEFCEVLSPQQSRGNGYSGHDSPSFSRRVVGAVRAG
jgi:hypothetical protein